MDTQANPKMNYSMIASLAISLLLWCFWLGATASSGDTATFLGFVTLAGFLFIALPALLYSTLIFLTRPKNVVLISLFSITVLSHLLLAFSMGFFEKWLGI